ncbi:MAG: DUF3857 domain-containing protein [Bacteroidota bacterium]
MRRRVVILLAMCAACFNNVKAQTAEEVRKKFPDEELVYYNYTQELRLFMKNDLPVAESRHERELMILSDKNASLYNRQSVYHSGYSELTGLEAYTKVPDGNQYKKVKINDQKTTSSPGNSVFYDDTKETSFNFPSLTRDAIGHLEYTQFHKDAHLLTPFYIPGSIPVINATYSVVVPNDISVKFVVKNDPGGIFHFTEEKKRKETIYRWSVNNNKGPDYYGDAPSGRYFEPHVIVYVASYENKDGRQNFLSSLDDLYKWNTSFTKQLNTAGDDNLKKIVDSLTKGQLNEKEKAKRIYRWVQHNIKYVAFEDGLEGFRPRQAAEVCNKRYGDCKDMSSIITQMLRMANIKAYYTWIGTRSLPYEYTDLPLPLVDNHMISVANIDDKWYFLDGTDPYSKLELPPSSIQDKEALIAISEKEYKVAKVPVAAAEDNLIIDSTFIQLTDAGIKGTEKVNYYGYFGEGIYNTLMYKDEKETKVYMTSKMGKASNKFILGNYAINKINPDENIINLTADFEIPGYSKKAGNEYYINLNLEKLFDRQVIDTAKRKVPQEIEYKYLIKQYHILDIPAGYTVTYKPDNFTFSNDLIALSISYEIKNGKIIAAQEYTSKKLMLYPSDFAEWNKTIKLVQPQYKEMVVLEKK